MKHNKEAAGIQGQRYLSGGAEKRLVAGDCPGAWGVQISAWILTENQRQSRRRVLCFQQGP